MDMKKIFLSIAFFCFLSIIFIPILASAQTPIVPSCPTATGCTIKDFFTMLTNIYKFIVLDIATPLAVLAAAVGGIFMMISAGNPQLLGMGKKILYSAIIGLVLVFASWVIINFILTTIGFTGNWQNPFGG
ncbi:MAG: hypothetical protein ABSA74_02640 [Candidatus Staskawiczbacteria bacterium]|jgi:type IV secretory pathway VirB2 component (pilin)